MRVLFGTLFIALFLCQGMQVQAAPKHSAPKQLTVSPDGTKRFTTIGEAVDKASTGDTILVYPGVYEESVVIVNKTLTIRGTDRDTCILQNQTEDYFTPPLMMPCGTLENMTLYAYQDPLQKDRRAESFLKEGTEGLCAADFTNYALHVESNYSYGKELLIKNCVLKSDCNHVIGIGFRGNFHVTVENSILQSGKRGSLVFLHDASGTPLVGQGFATFIQDSFISEKDVDAVCLTSFQPQDNHITLSMQNVDLTHSSGTVRIENANSETGMGIGGSGSFFAEAAEALPLLPHVQASQAIATPANLQADTPAAKQTTPQSEASAAKQTTPQSEVSAAQQTAPQSEVAAAKQAVTEASPQKTPQVLP